MAVCRGLRVRFDESMAPVYLRIVSRMLSVFPLGCVCGLRPLNQISHLSFTLFIRGFEDEDGRAFSLETLVC